MGQAGWDTMIPPLANPNLWQNQLSWYTQTSAHCSSLSPKATEKAPTVETRTAESFLPALSFPVLPR